MNASMRWKVFIILAAIVLAVISLWPTIRFYRMSDAQLAALDENERDRLHRSALRLGLDLQGGMHLVLEIDDSDIKDADTHNLMDQALEVIRNRVDEFGVSEPIIQKAGEKRIIVELPGIADFQRAQDIIRRAAVLDFAMVRSGEEMRRLVGRLDLALARAAGVAEPDSAAELEELADTTAAESAAAEQPDSVESLLPLPELATVEEEEGSEPPDISASLPMERLLARDVPASDGHPLAARIRYDTRRGQISTNEVGMVLEENVPIVERYLAYLDSTGAIPDDVEFVWHHEIVSRTYEHNVSVHLKYLYLLNKEPEITGDMLEDARAAPDRSSNIAGNFQVDFDLTRAGRRLFSRTTGDNVGRLMAIVLDGKVYSAPEIREKIRGGSANITGSFTPEEANDLAIVLRAGALPVPIRMEEQRSVGPSLGKDSIRLGRLAILYGFVAVMIFMVIYYHASGLIAVGALLLNLVFLLAILVELDAVLTLPGIAALVLTVGMAVDANVLIFERIREELRLGQTVRNAVSRGYDRAFRTILDANVTTLITALVLLRFGTGPIKGFAVTLSVGIVVSMFTALFVTRVVFDLVTTGRPVHKLSI
jgi:SecD/SecF fusion protein